MPVRDVVLDENGAIAQLLDKRLTLFHQDIGDDDPCTFLDQRADVGRAHPLRTAGDHGDLVVQQTDINISLLLGSGNFYK